MGGSAGGTRRVLGGGAPCVWGGPSRCVGGFPNRGGVPPAPPSLAQHSPRAQRAAAILFTGGCHGDGGPLPLAQPRSRGGRGTLRTTHPSMHRAAAPRGPRLWRRDPHYGSRARGPARAPTGPAAVPAAHPPVPPGPSAGQRAPPRAPGPMLGVIPVAGPSRPPRTRAWRRDSPGEAAAVCRFEAGSGFRPGQTAPCLPSALHTGPQNGAFSTSVHFRGLQTFPRTEAGPPHAAMLP